MNVFNPFLSLFQVSSFTVSCPVSIGKLVLIEIDKQHFLPFPEDSWFPAKVEVKFPKGDTYNFPIYHWITDGEVHRFREGTGLCKLVFFRHLVCCSITTEDMKEGKAIL